MDNKQILLQKIKALAEKGCNGEKQSAQEILERLMKKYGITESDLEQEKKYITWFSYKDEFSRRVLSQIIYYVTGKDSCGCRGSRTHREHKKQGVECTIAEKTEIGFYYEFYLNAAKKELEVFYTAFAIKNNLFPDPSKLEKPSRRYEDLTQEEKSKYSKAGLVAEGMDRHIMHDAIESKG